MSAGYPYLQKLRKSDLTELAEGSDLEDYTHLRKAELEVALDKHLRVNRTIFQNDPSFSEYYKRFDSDSPTKVIAKSDMPESKAVRKRSKGAEDPPTSSDMTSLASNKVSSMMKTPGRNPLSVPARVPLPPSPAVVTDAIDRQTAKIKRRVSGLYAESGLNEKSDSFRDLLSSPVAISGIALVVEAYSLRPEILPSRIAGSIPPIPMFTSERTPIYVPDLFMLLRQSFWAPFSLWLTTSLALPLACAYFVNIPVKSHSRTTQSRRHPTIVPYDPFDPVVYNLAKAFVAYIVYAHHCTIFGLFQHFTIATVNENIVGGYQGIVIGTILAGTLGLYEAILLKQ